MSDGPEIVLLCGLCPTRRVLCYLHSIGSGKVYVAPGKGRRERRPSVEGGRFLIPLRDGPPLRRRCRHGHPWEIPAPALQTAYTAAAESGRRELVAGVDV